jgi:hypothetical protein
MGTTFPSTDHIVSVFFPSRNYNFGGLYFEAWDNEEPCPECGFERAKLSEGIFDLKKDAVRVLSAPDITLRCWLYRELPRRPNWKHQLPNKPLKNWIRLARLSVAYGVGR